MRQQLDVDVIMKSMLFGLAFSLTLTCAYAQHDSVFVVISGDTTTIWNVNVVGNCASRFKCSVFISGGDDITLTETDTVGPVDRCLCSYDLSAVLTGLGAGHYRVDIFRQYLLAYGYPKDTTLYIGTTSFDLGSSGILVYSQQFQQSVCKGALGVEDGEGTPAQFILRQNFPEPFNPTTTIQFSLPKSSFVTLKVYNVLGQLIRTLVNERRAPGTYNVQFDVLNIPSGVYYYRLSAINPSTASLSSGSQSRAESREFVQTKKMLVIR